MKQENRSSLEDRVTSVKPALDGFMEEKRPAVDVSNRQVLFLRPAEGKFDDTPWNGEWKNYTDR